MWACLRIDTIFKTAHKTGPVSTVAVSFVLQISVSVLFTSRLVLRLSNGNLASEAVSLAKNRYYLVITYE